MPNFIDELYLYSNPNKAQIKAYKYLGNDAVLYSSNRKDKKYMIYDPINNKIIHFGQMGYKDFTKSNNLEKRTNYLKRSSKIKGDWINNKYSPNNLSINILW